MMDHFHELLDRYIKRTATDEEKEEFFRYVVSGEFDDVIIREGLRDMLDAELAQASRQEKSLFSSRDKIYASILSRNRIQTEAKVVDMHSSNSRIWYAAAAVAAMVVVSFLWVLRTPEVQQPPQIAVQEKVSKPGVYRGKQVVDLPDGTQVVLNGSSVLMYSQSFGIADREVTLEGEASFDVTHDPSRPFIVRTGKVNTKVLGTAFNIEAYPENNEVTVTVLRGLVEVGDDKHVYGKIRPDQQISVNTATNNYVQKDTKAEEEVAWQKNFLIFDDVSLEEAVSRIGAKFNVTITFENPALKNCKFYGSFLNDESLTDVLNMMSPVLNITYTVEDKVVLISGKGCN